MGIKCYNEGLRGNTKQGLSKGRKRSSLSCIVKRYLLYMHNIEGPLHTSPEECRNEDILLRLSLPSTLIHHENGTYRKRFSKRRNLETPAKVEF